MKKMLFPILALVLALGLTLPMAAPAAAHTEDDPQTQDLLAGQDINVGTVSVWNDETTLYVQYMTDADWVIGETHLAVATSLEGIPQTKKGNPKVGKFTYQAQHVPLVTEYTYAIPIPETWETGIEVCIAAHAVVQQVVKAAPWYASVIVDYEQGPKKDGNPVGAARSDPENALDFETGRDESNFFSLGFGGWIILEYDCPIRDGEGNDVKVIEDTWGGPYPLESASVWVSQDGSSWEWLGEADNTQLEEIHTISEFDLNDTLEWAKYIKVVDTTDPTPHNSAGDGFDLNAVASLQDCVREDTSETAWADGARFTPRGSWATYFTYTIQKPEEHAE